MTLIVRSESPATDRSTVWLEGRLDAATFAAFDEAMRDITPLVDNGGTLVIDLSALEYISSAGLRSLAQLHANCTTATAAPCCSTRSRR